MVEDHHLCISRAPRVSSVWPPRTQILLIKQPPNNGAVMRRRIAVVHDGLTSGGFILPYEQPTGFLFEGRAAAVIGG